MKNRFSNRIEEQIEGVDLEREEMCHMDIWVDGEVEGNEELCSKRWMAAR